LRVSAISAGGPACGQPASRCSICSADSSETPTLIEIALPHCAEEAVKALQDLRRTAIGWPKRPDRWLSVPRMRDDAARLASPIPLEVAMRRFSGRPSPAMAVAFIALLAALSGTAVALPGKNTVDSGDLKKNAVKAADIARNAVTAPKIRNGAVNGGKVRNDSLTGTDINESTLGQVPSANTANSANTADSANTASSANTANTANNASQLGGLPASRFLSEGSLRSGQTLTGTYAWAGNIGAGEFVPATPISLPIPLAAAPTVSYLPPGSAATAACPGTVDDPDATPGNLCVYGRRQDGAVPAIELEASGRTGARLFPQDTGNTQYDGTWAVTAP
jgi:hypothetical protein